MNLIKKGFFIVLTSMFAFIGCSSNQKNQIKDSYKGPDMISLVLRNYEPDFRYCITSEIKDPIAYNVDFVLLPSGNIFESKFETKNEDAKKYLACIKRIFDKIVFPPIKDKKAKNLNRELLFK